MLAISEPFFILFFKALTIYLLNILFSLLFVLIIVFLLKQIKIESSKKENISLIAHQLSSPLASIKWSLEMLLNNDFGKITKDQEGVIKNINIKNNQSINLVENLLDTAKIENKKYNVNRELCDIEELILDTIELYQDEINKNKIDFKFKKPIKKPRKIKVDEQKIKLVIQNLFENAIKYSLPGGKIMVFLKENNKKIEFKIQDSGIGIEKKYFSKIFSQFFRGDNAVKYEPMGHGLGLFFVKNIIESHGGKVWFESKESSGSTFYFTIPIKA